MSWDQVWIDVNVATMDTNIQGAYGVIHQAAIAVKDGKIAWVGPRSELPEFDVLATPVYRGKGGWITPGLIDAHTHLVFAGNRAHEFEQRLQGATYAEIARAGGGIISTVNACRDADEAELFELGRQRLNALAREGVTTVEIKSGYGLNTETELKLLRVARELGEHHHIDVCTTFLGAHAIPPEYKDNADAYIDLVINDMLPAVIAENLADAVDVFCENIAFSLEQTERVLTAAKQAGLQIKLHAEQLTNMGGSALAAKLGAKSVDHIEFLDEAGVKAISESGTCATLLPGAFYFLRETQLPPIELLRQYKVPMVIASDFNPGSSPICSTLLMLNMACTLFRLTPEEALQGVTINAAKALGIDNNVGSISIGKQADFCLWDITTPAQLAYAYGVNPCKTVVKKGQVVAIPN
ncbi:MULTISPECIES: imidazolonepropionase [Shewanella]|uniref:imidazolonepropionase n=1 Tax=Shewanella TaxID=22 RepID=UPI000C45560A|nr:MULTISPECIES: imidazolonepropionase [Shewanella]NCQ45756.1 imidazolonepropionase [Shewanella frigidimarina]NCO72427.1 imidazolonepropionase [Shewanella vesiculosa]NCP36121.1 imidazolonepropionase [Shewanella vesiculosa]NCP71251.1 imidazolonepropionase [Shewanella vesiculosa]NCP73785.1 imidazolonepropionase [Shewanella vesiculosa]|tara:strand:- start:1187 stop:2419 length:1233 start_codon:yes stop_codon:yes gene_type:complete